MNQLARLRNRYVLLELKALLTKSFDELFCELLSSADKILILDCSVDRIRQVYPCKIFHMDSDNGESRLNYVIQANLPRTALTHSFRSIRRFFEISSTSTHMCRRIESWFRQDILNSIEITHRCGTWLLARIRLTILRTPSPNIKPLARTTIGVSSRRLYDRQYQLTKPPIALASVNEGILYIPIHKLAESPTKLING